MDPSVLDHRLTEEERYAFERDGFLHLENALAPARVEQLTAITDRIHQGHVADGGAGDSAMFVADFIGQDPAFLDLVDHAPVIAKVWGALGWNISLYHTHLIVTPPSGKQRSEATFGWHQDSGRVNRDLPPPRPRLSIKIGYFLSDVSEEGRGNFWIVPGSHLRDELPVPDGQGQPEGAVPVLAKPGTAVMFDRRLWHAASPNWSDVTRKVLFYGYGYRWIRPKDELNLSGFYEGSDPVRRQLLGDGLNANGRYSPTDDDVPLKGWLTEHAPDDVRV